MIPANDSSKEPSESFAEVEDAVVTSWRVLFVIPSQNIAKLLGFTTDDDPIVEVDSSQEMVHTLQVYDRPSQQFHNVGIKGGHENILTTHEYVKKVNEDVSEDDHFTQGPWLMAIVYLHGQGVIASGCLGNVEKYCKNGKLELVVVVVKSCTPNSLRDMSVTLKDPTGIVGGTIHYKVFQNEVDGYTKSIISRSVLILRNVSVWTPKPSQHYLNITIRNIVKVFDKDTEF
nr:hypothetical protein [Tanacetum cinerariifolium]